MTKFKTGLPKLPKFNMHMPHKLPTPRLLPMTIVAMGALLVLKTVDLARTLSGAEPSGDGLVAAAYAADPAAGLDSRLADPHSAKGKPVALPGAPRPAATLVAATTPDSAAAPAATAPSAKAPDSPATGSAAGSTRPGGAQPMTGQAAQKPDPAKLAADRPADAANAAPAALPPQGPPVDDAERLILLDLRSRRAELDKREAAIAAREAVVAASEAKLAQRIDELTALQKKLEALDAARSEKEEANWRGLVKLYEGMKPREAAVIFNDLEMPVLLQLVDRMKESKAALVLAAMQPDRARLVTTQLAELRTKRTEPPSSGAGG